MPATIPVLLDTDIGSDIDDAVCLAYLLRQPRCELLGITTVSGDVNQRAACARIICQEAGRPDVPVHAGASEVLLHGVGQPNVPQFSALAHRHPSTAFAPATAVEFLRRTIRQRPGEITLLSIGPYTNLALLFAIDPEIPALLRQVVSMAGVFYPASPRAEWNCHVDPLANEMVYRRRIPRHLSVGLDVTERCILPAPEVRDRFTAKPLSVVLEMAEVWFGKNPDAKITFHDPLAAALLFNPTLCTYETGTVETPLERDPKLWGRTLFAPSPTGPHRIARQVDPQAFFTEYFSVFD